MTQALLPSAVLDRHQVAAPDDLVSPVLMALTAAFAAHRPFVTSDEIEKILISSVSMLTLAETEPAQKTKPDGPTVFRDNLDQALEAVRRSGAAYAKGAAAKRQWIISEAGTARVLATLLAQHQVPEAPMVDQSPNAPRITETAAALVLLARLAAHQPTPREETPKGMTELLPEVKKMLPLSTGDVAGLKNRKDTRIDQVIRNVISNKVLEIPGLISAVDPSSVRPKYVITPAGRAHLTRTLVDAVIPTHLIGPTLGKSLADLRSTVRTHALIDEGDRLVAEYVAKHPDKAEAIEAFRRQAEQAAENGTIDELAQSVTSTRGRARRGAPAASPAPPRRSRR